MAGAAPSTPADLFAPRQVAANADDLATVCVLCSHNCSIRVDVRDDHLVKVRGDASSPASRGYMCNKAVSIDAYVNHAERVETPLRRRADGGFDAISWDEAIAEISARMRAIHAAHGGRAFGIAGIGGQSNHSGGAYALALFNGLGSDRWYCALAQEKTQHWWLEQRMFDSRPGTILFADEHRCDVLLVMGSNPRISNRGVNANDTLRDLHADPARRLIVADPRRTETSRLADLHLPVKPGHDAYMMIAIVAAVLEEGLEDADFLAERASGVNEVRDLFAGVDVGATAARAGLAEADVRAAARIFAGARAGSILYDLSVEQIWFSTLVSYLIHLLLALTGNVCRPGTNNFIETFPPPMRLPDRFDEPTRATASGIPAIRTLSNIGMYSPNLVPEEIMVDSPERMRVLFVENANPWLSYADTQAWEEARSHLDLMVVLEPAMTETAKRADYVLPTHTGYEKWELCTFPKHYPDVYAQLRPPVVRARSGPLHEAEIYMRLIEALGIYGEPPAALRELAPEAMTAAGAMRYLATAQMLQAQVQPEGASLLRGGQQIMAWSYRALDGVLPDPMLVSVWLQCQLNGMFRAEGVLRALGEEWRGADFATIGNELFRRLLAHPESVLVARADEENALRENFGFEDGRARLALPDMLDEVRRALTTDLTPPPEFPLVLASGLRTRWTANTIHRNPAWRKGRGPHCSLHASPADAARLGLADGAEVRLATRRASVVVPIEVDEDVEPGHVWLPNGFGGGYRDASGAFVPNGVNLNLLTDAADRDPFTGCPHHKTIPCRIDPIADPAT